LRIDHTHRRWAITTAILFGASLAIYVPYSVESAHGPSGGSGIGLAFGVFGYGLMIFATLLSLRKRFTTWRIGRAQTWMRGHLWLGLLSYPIILFHAGFSLGGSLTTVLMILITLVVASGIFGAVLQHYIPQVITERVAMETIYDQISRVRSQLVDEADKLRLAFSPTLEGLLSPAMSNERRIAALTLKLVNSQTRSHLTEVYSDQIRPYLASRNARGSALRSERDSKFLFDQMRTVSPQMLHEIFNDLENICQEKRDLDKQSRYHRLLHGWLLGHVPLAVALMVLGLIHAVIALRY
jgi:hypothetical protein